MADTGRVAKSHPHASPAMVSVTSGAIVAVPVAAMGGVAVRAVAVPVAAMGGVAVRVVAVPAEAILGVAVRVVAVEAARAASARAIAPSSAESPCDMVSAVW